MFVLYLFVINMFVVLERASPVHVIFCNNYFIILKCDRESCLIVSSYTMLQHVWVICFVTNAMVLNASFMYVVF